MIRKKKEAKKGKKKKPEKKKTLYTLGKRPHSWPKCKVLLESKGQG